jgi:hypothetical protein
MSFIWKNFFETQSYLSSDYLSKRGFFLHLKVFISFSFFIYCPSRDEKLTIQFRNFRKFTSISYSMSSNIQNTTDIQLLATYGTLRDDDNSGAAWTKPFIKVFFFVSYLIDNFEYLKDISSAVTGRVTGYQLFRHSYLNYPFAIFTGAVR